MEKESCENNDIEGNDAFWFRVGQALDFDEPSDVNDFLIDNGLNALENKDKAKFANRTLFKLNDFLHKSEIINYFLEKDESLDKVLNIFIRVNSGGTELSYSDLLLSIATAKWKKKDARKEINDFVEEINCIGDGFNFDKDFVLKTCLVLCGFSDIAFKVDNFNSENMTKIEMNWDKISESIRLSISLLSSFGLNRDTLTSNNAVIPISYYIYEKDNPKNIELSIKYKEDRVKIFKWLNISLLKRTFGGQPDNVLRPVRQIISEHNDEFPLSEITEKLKTGTKSITFTNEEIDSLLDYKWGQKYTFSVLSILYPNLDYRNKFHIDHIFPKKLFTWNRLQKRGVPDEKIYDYISNYNCIGNLQLLEGLPNQEKSGMDFDKWLRETYPNLDEMNNYLRRNYIPDTDLSISNFLEFFNMRENILQKRLTKILMLSNNNK